MSKSRCIFCMEETQGQYAICPRCKKGIWEYQWKETYLEPYTTLGERYFVGVILEETEESMRYVGYDLVLEQKVMIYVYPYSVVPFYLIHGIFYDGKGPKSQEVHLEKAQLLQGHHAEFGNYGSIRIP